MFMVAVTRTPEGPFKGFNGYRYLMARYMGGRFFEVESK